MATFQSAPPKYLIPFPTALMAPPTAESPFEIEFKNPQDALYFLNETFSIIDQECFILVGRCVVYFDPIRF